MVVLLSTLYFLIKVRHSLRYKYISSMRRHIDDDVSGTRHDHLCESNRISSHGVMNTMGHITQILLVLNFLRSILMAKIIFLIMVSMLLADHSFGQTKNNDLPTVEEVQDNIQRSGKQWTAKRNRFMDMSQAEIDATHGADDWSTLSRDMDLKGLEGSPYDKDVTGVLTDNPLPSAHDWRNHNGKDYTTPTKYQSSCGACVTFATVAIWETLLKIQYLDERPSFNPDLSEQFIVSCPLPKSCFGVNPTFTIPDMVQNGTYSETYIPYIAKPVPCSEVTSGVDLTKIGHYRVMNYEHVVVYEPGGDDVSIDMLKRMLVEIGPFFTVMMQYDDFYLYAGGVYSTTPTASYRGLHAVCVIGYDDAEQCFIVKNSWGDWWGINGYFKIAYSEATKLSRTTFGLDTWAFSGAVIDREEPEQEIPPIAKVINFPTGTIYAHDRVYNVTSEPATAVSFAFRTDGGTWSEQIPILGSLWIYDPTDGPHTLEVITCSVSGACQSKNDPTTYHWINDTTPPEFINITNPPAAITDVTSYVFNVTASADTVKYMWASDLISGWSAMLPISNATITLNDVPDGKHYIILVASDVIDNYSEHTRVEWTVSSKITALLSDLPNIKTTDTSTRITVSSNSSKYIGYRYRLDGSMWSATADKDTKIQLSGLSTGVHTLEVIAVGSDGSIQDETATSMYAWIIEEAAAAVAVLQNPPDSVSTASKYQLYVGGENTVAYKYSIDGQPLSQEYDINTPINLTLSSGLHILRLSGKNNAGVWQESYTTNSWTVKRSTVNLGAVYQLLLN